MSEYSFGSFDPDDMSDPGEAQGQQPQGPKWFREGLDKLSSQVRELQEENNRLKRQQRQQTVADTLKAKGYNPAAAGLFTGEPEKLDEWLTANGGALAKLPEGQPQEQQQAPQGPPPTTVPADGQEQMQRMQEQGTQGVAAPQGTDAEVAAALKAADPAAFAKMMEANGSPFNWGDFIG